jgi:hypothetical protein
MTEQFELKSNKYALQALKDQRAVITSKIAQLKRRWHARLAHLLHIDATIQLFDPSVDLDTIFNKRTIKHARLFRNGELGSHAAWHPSCGRRLIVEFPAIVTFAMQEHAIHKWRTVVQRVRSNR